MSNGKISSILTQLREQKAAIEAAIEALERVEGSVTDLGDSEPTPSDGPAVKGMAQGSIPRNAFYGMKIPDAIIHYLGVSKRKQTVGEIMTAIKAGGVHSKSKNLYSNVYTALFRLEKDGEVGKFGKEWGLAEWFPGATRKRTKPEKAQQGAGSDKSDG